MRSRVHRTDEPVLPNPKFVTRVSVRFLNINQKNIQSSTELPDHHKVTFSFNYNFDFPFIECEKPFKVNWAQLNINYWLISVCTSRGLINWTIIQVKACTQPGCFCFCSIWIWYRPFQFQVWMVVKVSWCGQYRGVPTWCWNARATIKITTFSTGI